MTRERAQDEAERPRHLAPWLALGLAVLVVVGTVVGLGLSGRSLPVPQVLVGQIEARVNRALAGQAKLQIGHADLVVGAGFVPQVRLADSTLLSPRGQRLALVSDLRANFDPGELVRGRLAPLRLTARGARIAIRREVDGSLDIAPAARNFSGVSKTPAQIADSVDEAFSAPELAGIQAVSIEGLAILFDDRRAGQVWTITNGELLLTQSASEIRSTLSFAAAGQSVEPQPQSQGATSAAPEQPAPAQVQLTLVTDKHSSAARLSASLSGISARDLAPQVPAIAWLGALEAPISGQFESGLNADGTLRQLDARLSVGKGGIRPQPGVPAVPFDHATVGLTFDPAKAELTLTDLSIESPRLSARATGQAWLKGNRNGRPESVVAQILLSDFKADATGVFDQPVTIGQGALDAKLDLSPFRLTIGQLTLIDGGHTISAKGNVGAAPAGWSVAMDVAIDAISTERLIALWPVSAVPNTRTWLATNVATGELFDVRSALRLTPGETPRFALSYQYRGAEVRFMKSLPPITDGAGYATINDNTYTMVAERGHVVPPAGGKVDISGSVMIVPDIREIPATADFTLRTKSSVTGALSILDQPPFEFLTKAGQPVDLAEGNAELLTRLKFKLQKTIQTKDVSYDVTGTLIDVSSDKIVKGRKLAAKSLNITASPDGLAITGQATLDGVPVNGTWRQGLDPESKGKSRVEGTMEVSPATLKAFAIGLPDGAVKGTGQGRFSVDLVHGQAPAFRFDSDLAGLTLAIPEVGWQKAPGVKGSLSMVGTLGQPTHVDRIEAAAAGLKAAGTISLKADGGLDTAAFTGATLADWFKGDVTITGRGKGRTVAIAIANASADMRKATFSSGRSSGREAPPLTVSLKQLQVSDGITLTDFNGSFITTGGMNGPFSASVNGKAPITGRVTTTPSGRAAFEVRSDDAGRVLDAADIYSSGRGGALRLMLTPAVDEGTYDGDLGISSIRVVHAPGLAGLLNAISVVGLIEQLQGPGILFSDVTGQFLLMPQGVEIRRGSAIGASLGVSGSGVYRSADHSYQLQGVISPVYLLNGIGQIFSRQREGLFGFNYTLTGTRDKTNVSVNPLSILTPGMFRDLFRKDPPRIGQ